MNLNRIKQFYGQLKFSEVHLQVTLNQIKELPNISPYYFRILDKSNQIEIENWIDLLNEAYSESKVNLNEAHRLLNNHHFLENTETYLVFDNDNVIASVSIGLYSVNTKVGGVYRLAVRKSYQNKGLGKFIILLGYNLLKSKGIDFGESVINTYRDKSIVVHMQCGLKPQTNPKKITHKNSNFNKNIIQRIRAKYALKKAYKTYLLKLEKNR